MFTKGCPETTALSYPIKKTNLDFGEMVSVVRGRNDYHVPAPVPPEESADTFLKVRKYVKVEKWPAFYFEDLGIDPTPPKMFERYRVTHDRPSMAATLVNHSMDHPLDLHKTFVLEYGNQLKEPQSFGKDFIGMRWLEAKVTDAIFDVLKEVFQLKYFYGQERPEEFFMAGTLVTAYPCPAHPAFAAGHGAIDGATVAVWKKYCNLDFGQLEEMEHAARHHAHYRTLGGVHWPEDNDWGYVLGGMKVAGPPKKTLAENLQLVG